MPHDALAAAPTVGGRPPEVILGDRFGAACDRWLIDAATEAFAAAGFAVARNAPFAGGYITQTYGRPQRGVQALQIEIDRVALHGRGADRAAAGVRRGGRAGSAAWSPAWLRSGRGRVPLPVAAE